MLEGYQSSFVRLWSVYPPSIRSSFHPGWVSGLLWFGLFYLVDRVAYPRPNGLSDRDSKGRSSSQVYPFYLFPVTRSISPRAASFWAWYNSWYARSARPTTGWVKGWSSSRIMDSRVQCWLLLTHAAKNRFTLWDQSPVTYRSLKLTVGHLVALVVHHQWIRCSHIRLLSLLSSSSGRKD